MRSIVLALAATLFPLAAQAGENVAYTVDGEAFEGYRAKPTGASKGPEDFLEKIWRLT